MKRILFALLMSLPNLVIGQNYYYINFEGADSTSGLWHDLYLDTISNPNNIWQVGVPQKNNFTSAASQPNAIVTDLINPYPINDTSSFILAHQADYAFGVGGCVFIDGMFSSDCDSLNDFGKIEFKSANTPGWIDLMDPTYDTYVAWNYQEPEIFPVFTGNSNGWQPFRITMCDFKTLFNIQIYDTVHFRFTFISDAIQTNRDGLMFDSIRVWDTPPISVEEKQNIYRNARVSPNPTSSKTTFYFENTHWENRQLLIYNAVGKLIYSAKIDEHQSSIEINLSGFVSGIYEYQFMDKNGLKTSAGKFVKVE